MATMVDDPYVWHVPALTSASGGAEVRSFYVTQLIGHTPADAVQRPIARTVSADRVVDEFVPEFTHDIEMPFMLPGVAPTGRTARIPTVEVMAFENDMVAFERIYWDQASAAHPGAGAARRPDGRWPLIARQGLATCRASPGSAAVSSVPR